MRQQTTAHIAVLFTNLFFALNFSLVKYISPSAVGPFGLNLIRVGISLFLFWTLWLFSKNKTGIRKKDIGRFALCGLTGVAVNQVLFIKGLTMTSTVHASLLMLCTPLLITLFAFWILKEKVTLLKATGLALGIGGAALLILSKEKNGTANAWGDVIIVLNAVSYTFYFILVKPLMQIYSPLHVVRWAFTFGFLLILPVGFTQFNAVDWGQFDASRLTALGVIVVCGTFLAYCFNAFGIKYLGAGTTGSYIYTQPVFAAIIAAVFLSEKFTLEKIISAILIFAGVYLVTRKRETPVIEE